MYSLGVEGDETLLQQQNGTVPPQHPYGYTCFSSDGNTRGAELQQPQQYCRVDEEDPSPRGEEHTPLLHSLTRKLLRLSLSLKTISMALMCVFFLAFGGRWIFTFHAYPEMSHGFHLTMVVLMMFYLAGTLLLSLFQAFVADDSKWTRGFRTGSKMLSAATTLDSMAALLRLCEYLQLFRFLSVSWWAKFSESKSQWLLFAVSNVMDALALLCYGAAFFYMEVYHDQGTSEDLAWLILSLFSLAGLLMMSIVFLGGGAVFMLLTVAGAHIAACYWAFLFEPLLDKWSPQLHCRDINTDIALPSAEPGGQEEAGAAEEEAALVAAQQQHQQSQNGYYYYGGTAAPNGGGVPAVETNEGAYEGGVAAPQQYNTGSPAILLPAEYQQQQHAAAAAGGPILLPAGAVPQQPYAPTAADIPTHYDYSQLQQQVAQGVEMGVLNTNYQ